MKLEIKNISLRSVMFSVFPLVVFAISFINSFFAVGELSEFGIMSKVLQLVLWTLAETLVITIVSVVVAFVYNLFCSFGMRGIRVEIEEVLENKSEQTETEEK